MKKIIVCILCLCLFISFCLFAVAAVKEGDLKEAARFYRGKVITSIVPTKPGGSYDIYARLLIPFLEKYTGAKVVVKNISGGGGTMGINAMYRAKPDGLTIGNLMIAGTSHAQMVGAEGIDYDLLKFTYLCRLTDDPQVFVVGKNTPYRNFSDLLKAKEKIKLASTGTSGATYIGALTIKLGFDLANVDVITGYQGGQDCNLAVMRGDVVGMVGSVSGRLRNIKDGDLRPLVVFASKRVPDLPEVPTVFEFGARGDKLNILKAFTITSDYARVLVATPGIPAEKVEFLRIAVRKSMQDPKLLEFAKKQGYEINYLPGKEVEKAIKEMFANPPKALIAELKKVM